MHRGDAANMGLVSEGRAREASWGGSAAQGESGGDPCPGFRLPCLAPLPHFLPRPPPNQPCLRPSQRDAMYHPLLTRWSSLTFSTCGLAFTNMQHTASTKLLEHQHDLQNTSWKYFSVHKSFCSFVELSRDHVFPSRCSYSRLQLPSQFAASP